MCGKNVSSRQEAFFSKRRLKEAGMGCVETGIPPRGGREAREKGWEDLTRCGGGLEMVRVWARLETAERLLSVFCSL